jgi:hypothetical protein
VPVNPLAIAGMTIAGGWMLYRGVRGYMSPASQLKRQIRVLPRRMLAELPEGTPARIVGKADVLEDTLEAPLTGRRCLYYTAIVEVSDGRDWLEIVREDRAVMFILDDGTARTIVDPSRSKVALDFDGASASGTFDDPNEREQAFLDQHKTSSRHGRFNRNLRYREAIIGIGETIAIFGAAMREPDPTAQPEAAYRGDAPTRLRMASSPKHPMMISDHPSTTR